jgi:hypothetical protein
MRRYAQDAQQALGFLVSQVTSIEAQVVKVLYPDIQYHRLIPTDTSANEWAKSVTWFSMDKLGRAQWFNHMANDMPLADVQRSKFEQGIEMAGIGYRYDLEEIGQAMLIPGSSLSSDKAEAARRAAEEFIDDIALRGSTVRNWTGLFNDPNVTNTTATAGAAGATLWATTGATAKTADEIIADVNSAITGVYSSSLTVELADTLLLPVTELARLATRPRATGSDMSIWDWIVKYNVYTATTGQPLTVQAARGLEVAGAGSTNRLIAYRRDPQVLKLHLPMPHRFLPVWQTGPITFDIPGILRLGGVEVRRPGAIRYFSGF